MQSEGQTPEWGRENLLGRETSAHGPPAKVLQNYDIKAVGLEQRPRTAKTHDAAATNNDEAQEA